MAKYEDRDEYANIWQWDNAGPVVYFLHAVGTPFVKIGCTDNLPKRLNSLQSGCPFELEPVALLAGYLELERKLHRRFERRRFRREWFVLNGDMMGFIRKNGGKQITSIPKSFSPEDWTDNWSGRPRKRRP